MNDTPISPEKKNSFDLDEVELHGDIQVGRTSSLEEKKDGPKSFKGLMWLFLALTVALASALAFSVLKYRTLKMDLDLIAEKKGETQADLSATEDSLHQIRAQLDQGKREAEKLNDEIRKLKGENEDLKSEKDSLEKKLTAGEKALSKSKKRAAAAEKKAKNEAGKTAKAEKTFLEYRQANEKKLADLNAELDQNNQATLTLQKDLEDQQTQFQQLAKEHERLKKQLKEEGSASLSLIQERSQLRDANAQLTIERDRLRKALNQANGKIQNLERVDTGELVPFSSQISPALPTFQEPFPKELKIPRRQGPLVIQMLINEVGAVEKAFIVPGQEIDREVARSIINHVKSWKFSPPTLDGVRVKTWQPILVHTK